MPACIIRPARSARSTACSGRRMLYEFCASHGVPHRKVGKLIVATDEKQTAKIEGIARQGEINGVEGLELIGANAARAMEPALYCVAALHSPETGIIDSHAFMLALQGDLEDRGGMIAFNTPVERLARTRGRLGGALRRRRGRHALGRRGDQFGRARRAEDRARHRRLFAARACRAWCSPRATISASPGKPAFSQLIYPAPVEGGLGTHVTLDMAGRMRFGPDVEWIEQESYTVDPKRAESFYASVRTYWPALPDNSLVPDYCGIRPKLTGKGEAGGGFPDRRPGRARPAAAGASVRDRVARPDLGAVDRRGGRRADSNRDQSSGISSVASVGTGASAGAAEGFAAVGTGADVAVREPRSAGRSTAACAARPRSLAACIAISAALTLSPLATMSPGRKVGSDATSMRARPNESLPLQVQPSTIFWR